MHSVRNLQRRATLCSRLRFGNGSVDRNFASRAFLADHIVQTPISYDVAIAFTSVSNVAAAPTCLLSFDNHYASAPAIMDLETKLETAYQNRALGLYGSIKPYEMDLAACLASPVTVEESAAEILRSTAAQLASEQQARLQMRFASEVRLTRQRSFEENAASSHQNGRSSCLRNSFVPVLASPSNEFFQAFSEVLEVQQSRNRLVLPQRRVHCGGLNMQQVEHTSFLVPESASLSASDEPPIMPDAVEKDSSCGVHRS